MRKQLLFVFALFAFCRVEAQFFEGFEGTTIPDASTGQWPLATGDWLVSDNGVGGNEKWEVTQAVTTPPYVFEGTNAAFVGRENIGQGNIEEDWLVTPAVSVAPNNALTFYTRTTISGDQLTYYQVLVSTTSQTDHASFVPVAVWAESDLAATFNIYSQKAVSLDEFAGQEVYIAFVRRYMQPDATLGGDRWLIDNVSVAEAPPFANQPINTIQGMVSVDLDDNGCDATDGTDYIRISANNGSHTYFKYAYNGEYSMTIPGTDFTVTPANYNITIFDATPQTYTFNFTGSSNTGTADFCFTLNENVVHDVNVEIVQYGAPPRPGFNSSYKVIVQNLGNLTENGAVSFSFDDDLLDVVSATDAVITTGNATWTFTNMQPLQTRTYYITLNANSPSETPPVNIGDIFNFTATAAILEDAYPGNNSAMLEQTVVGSYDPNDKAVHEGATISPDQTDEFLHYVIRFQNTGTAAAEFVRITDDLSANLDLSTLDIISASHDVRLSFDGNRAEFLFENIDLPPAADGENESQGYVAYKIKPVSTFGLGNSISNTAKIYFDYNFPIITNTVTTTVAELGLADLNRNYFTLYPNPATQSVTIEMQDETAVKAIHIFNLLGQAVKTIIPQFENGAMRIDVSDLDSGTYFIQIVSAEGKTTKKLIKS